MTATQEAAVERLGAALDEFGAALAACLEADLDPAEALGACGIQVPGWASPLIRRQLAAHLANEDQ